MTQFISLCESCKCMTHTTKGGFCGKCKNQKPPIPAPAALERLELQRIRNEFSEFYHNILWYERRGGLLPYDWVTYGHPYLMRLCIMLKVDKSDAHILKQDKRGAWR